jgi:predicted thioesterase/RimJ/RimL family protein N-acetyltransferase
VKDTLKPGLRGEHVFHVPESKTVPRLYPEASEFQLMPRVFATGFLVGLVEWTCLRVVNPHLDWPREQTVGTHLDLSHTAATPPGMTVQVDAELIAVEGRKLVFRVSATDGKDVISEGRHERFVVDAARFGERVAKKGAEAGIAVPQNVESTASGPRFDPRPVTLEGTHVRLEPLAAKHVAGLFEAGRDASIWRYLPRLPFATEDDARSFVEAAMEGTAKGSEVAFASVSLADGRVVGSTRYLDIRRGDRALEIGWTWLTTAAQRTPVNTECKYLLLRHAFDDLGAVRVQLKTDARNERSQRAIERIGGLREGVLRRHMTLPDGHVRDTVMYGITDLEWPAVKARLEERLRR